MASLQRPEASRVLPTPDGPISIILYPWSSQLRELNWLDQGYNIMLMGPSGVGKTLLASGLCSDAIDKGYKAYFRTMEDLVNMIKMRDMTRTATADYKRLSQADLIVIDDIMLFPVEK